MMFMGPFEIALFATMLLSIAWAFLGLIVLGRTLNLRWGLLAPLSIVPVAVLGSFFTAGITGLLDRFVPNEEGVFLIITMFIFLPWPLLITLLIRAARRMQMSDGRVVAEVFK